MAELGTRGGEACKEATTNASEPDGKLFLVHRKVSVKREQELQRIVWPDRWGFTIDEYKELNAELRKGNDNVVLPHHECPVKNDFEPFQPNPRYTRPLPRSNMLYGWKYANSEVHPTYKWEKRIASRYFQNQVGWPYGSQE